MDEVYVPVYICVNAWNKEVYWPKETAMSDMCPFFMNIHIDGN